MPEPALAPPKKKLGEMLLEAGLITPEQLEAATTDAAGQGRRLGEYLAGEGMVSAENLARTLSVQLNVPFLDLKRHTIREAAIALVPEEYARRQDLVPVDIVDDCLIVVMADPGNVQVLEDLEARARLPIRPAVGIPSDIRDAINRNYRAGAEIDAQVSRLTPAAVEQPGDDLLSPDAVGQAPIARTVFLLIAQAVRDRASDIHLEPQTGHLRVRYRIDGVLQEVQTLPLGVHAQLLSRVKVLAGMNIAERRRPQDGQFSIQVEGRDIDFRVATSDSVHGELMVLRVLDKSLSFMELQELGFQPQSLQAYEAMLRIPFGMILVGGPTGSGKTTTLYASANQLDRTARNVVSIEDPVEYQFDDINQIQVNPKADITFAGGLRSIMRLDPDVILVGEVRDSETARIAVQASLTGHLVMSSIHANDAVGVLFRLLDLGVEPSLISSALVGVVAQRMVRLNCPHCIEPREATPDERLLYEQETGEPVARFQRGDGCTFCANTGFLGRAGVFEVLPVTDELRRLLLAGAGSSPLRALAAAEGTLTIKKDAMLKAAAGVTTPEEAIRAVYSIL